MALKKSTSVDVAFFVLMFSIFVSLNSITSVLFGVSQIASPLILICCVYILYFLKVQKSTFSPLVIRLVYTLFFSYYLIGLFSRIFHNDVTYGVSIYSQVLNFITSLIVIVSVHQYLYSRLIYERKETKVFNSIYIPIVLSNLYSIYQALSGSLITNYGYSKRAMGFFANPNALGFLSNIGLLLTLYSLIQHKRYFYLKLLLVPALFYVSFLSLSRTAMIVSIVLLVFWLFWITIQSLRRKGSISQKMLLVVTILLGFTTYLILNFESILINNLDYWQAKKVISTMALVFEGKITAETTSGRTELVDFGLQAISNHPIIGNGLGYFLLFPGHLNFTHGVHNTFLLIVGDSGILPFAVCLFLVFYILFRSIWIGTPYALLAFGSTLVWSLHNFGNHNGLNNKMANILLAISCLYYLYSNSIRYTSTKPKISNS